MKEKIIVTILCLALLSVPFSYAKAEVTVNSLLNIETENIKEIFLKEVHGINVYQAIIMDTNKIKSLYNEYIKNMQVEPVQDTIDRKNFSFSIECYGDDEYQSYVYEYSNYTGFFVWGRDILDEWSIQSIMQFDYVLNDSDVEKMINGDFGWERVPSITETVKPEGITITINGAPLSFDVAPVMESDRVLVPFRAIFEAFGAEVGWDGETQTVTASKDGLDMSLQIDNLDITVNGKTITLDVPPRLANNRTLVSVRAVSEGSGATVDWNENEQMVIINTQQ